MEGKPSSVSVLPSTQYCFFHNRFNPVAARTFMLTHLALYRRSCCPRHRQWVRSSKLHLWSLGLVRWTTISSSLTYHPHHRAQSSLNSHANTSPAPVCAKPVSPVMMLPELSSVSLITFSLLEYYADTQQPPSSVDHVTMGMILLTLSWKSNNILIGWTES